MLLLLLFGFSIVILILVSGIIMPWVNHSRIGELQREVNQLRKKLKELTEYISQFNSNNVNTVTQQYNEPAVEQQNLEEDENINQPEEQVQAVEREVYTQEIVQEEAESYVPEPQPEPEPQLSFEERFGARLPVWIGGVALALAGFYLVKWSIDNNLIGPEMRVVLGVIFGVGLLYGGKWVRQRPDFANGIRISQSLTGAGIAVLYVSVFAASRLYEIVPMFVGFIGMAAVTAIALVLSLRHGPPIALLGFAGGFLTPALLSTGSGNILGLFIYLYFTASGLLIVIRKTQWWWLSIPTIIASFLWVLAWLFDRYTAGDSIYLGLFLVAIAATIVISSRRQYEDDIENKPEGRSKLSSILNYIGLGGTLMIMGLIGAEANFGGLEWGLFALLAIAGIGLAYFNDKLYGFVPWISMAVNAVMIVGWHTKEPYDMGLTILTFSFIYIASGYILMFMSRRPIIWGSLAGITSVSYYLMAYAKLHKTSLLADIPFFWGGLAIILTAMAVYVLFRIYNKLEGYPYKEHLYTIFTVAATTFISLALFIELDKEFLSVAVATQVLALAWINNKVSIASLRSITAIVACVFGFVLLPQILLLFQLTAFSLVEAKLHLQEAVPIVKWPFFQLGIPACMLLGSAYLLCKQRDNNLIRWFEVASIALIAVMGYYVTRNIIHPDSDVLFIKAGFNERGIITNVLFVYGLLCMFCGRYWGRWAFSQGGTVLCLAAVFRVVYFDMFLYNPLWEAQKISGVTIFNSLLLPFGLPVIWSIYARRQLRYIEKYKTAGLIGGFILAIVFMLVSLNVRHIFHGQYLNHGITSNAEIYSYSAAWLVLGVVILFAGIIRKDIMLRYASLCVILFTVGKVFLYDASELEGLFRVFSFLGLGVSLIGISYFYTRFVFGRGNH